MIFNDFDSVQRATSRRQSQQSSGSATSSSQSPINSMCCLTPSTKRQKLSDKHCLPGQCMIVKFCQHKSTLRSTKRGTIFAAAGRQKETVGIRTY
eukprot:scaffold18138_cov64-Attheya_sp.AAC.1